MKRLCLIITIIFAFGMIPLGLSLAGIIDCDYTSDFLRQQLPFIYEFKRMLASGTPWWSWNTFLGDNFIAEYSYYGILSPFNWFCCLFPEKYVALAFFISVYLRMLCTGLFAYLYFKRMNVSEHSAILGGILYTFSSFCIINLTYMMFCEAVMFFPLMLIGIENILKQSKNSFTYLALITFATIAIQYYCAVATLLCSIIYLACRVNQAQKPLKTFITVILSISVGVILSSIILLPTAMHIIGGNRGDAAQMQGISNIILSTISRLFWAIIPKIIDGLPFSYMFGIGGSITLYIQIFGITLACIYTYYKRDWLALCLFIFACLYFTPLNGLFTLFTSYSYCRWGYCFILMIILATVKCIDERIFNARNAGICISVILIYVISYIALCQYFLWKSGKPIGLNGREIIELAFGLISIASLYWLCSSHKRMAKYSICATSIASTFNLFITIYLIAGGSDFLRFRTPNFSDMLRDCIIENPIKPTNETFLAYRTDIIHPYFYNGSLLNGLPGITCYHSLYNSSIINFTDYIIDYPLIAETTIHTPRESLASLLSVRDVIRFNSGTIEDSDYNFGLTFKEKLSKHDKYSFDYYIPMGMVYDSYVTRSQLDSLRNADKDADLCLMMLDNIVIEDCDEAEIEKVLRKSVINTDITLDSITAIRRQYTTDFKGTSKGYTITTHSNTPAGMVFISTPCDDGFTATIDGESTKIYRVNMGMSGIMVPAGKHIIEATYLAPGLKLGAAISGICALLLIAYTILGNISQSRNKE